MKAQIPIQESEQVHEARHDRRRQKLNEQKEESKSLLSGGQQPNAAQRPPAEKVMPAKSQKIVGRNEKVSVQYADGKVLKDVKFKKVEEDIRSNKCVLIED